MKTEKVWELHADVEYFGLKFTILLITSLLIILPNCDPIYTCYAVHQNIFVT